MKRFPCKPALFGWTASFLPMAALFALSFVSVSTESLAQQKPVAGADDKKIHIVSDLLTTNNEAGIAEFSGNVKAVQGTTVIYSDKLKIFYKQGSGSDANTAGGASEVEKIVATGNVKINFDDKTAVSEQAEYMTETQIVVLSGKNTKVTTPEESISGAKITLYRADGRVKVESGKGKRVEAIFYDAGQKIGN